MPKEKPALDLLKVAFIGNVDDGKSTLIGRLFHDTDSIFEDQKSELKSSSQRRGEKKINLALFTDGLRAEREQGITIDIAYRYFSTQIRKFVVVDCPGHFQYTRNMITGCSTADAVVVLIDAEDFVKNGIVEQTKRHLAIASLLGIRGFAVCVNKMDRVEYSESVFLEISDALKVTVSKLGIRNHTLIPISATDGDNVVEQSPNMPWYAAQPLLSVLEKLDLGVRNFSMPFRLPIQRVIRGSTPTNLNFRGYAGRIASGTIRPGDEIEVGTSGIRARVKGVHTYDEPDRTSATAPDSVVLTLEDDIDISRGDLLGISTHSPRRGNEVDLRVCWLSPQSLDPNATYFVKHLHHYLKAKILTVGKKLDIPTLTPIDAGGSLGMNEIAEVRMKFGLETAFDLYSENRTTGSLIIIDPKTNQTVGAGLIL